MPSPTGGQSPLLSPKSASTTASPQSADRSLGFRGADKLSSAAISELVQSCQTMASTAAGSKWFGAEGGIEAHSEYDEHLLDTTATDVRIGITSSSILAVNWCGSVTQIDVLFIFLRTLLFGLLFVVLYFALGPAMQPGGEVFSPLVTILFAALVGFFICKLTQWPAIIGTFIGGLIWVALPQRIAGTCPPLFYSIVRTVAVAVILSRSGINFRWAVIKPVFLNVIGLAVLPAATEVLGHALVARQLFPSTWLAAIIQGAVAAPVSNAVMIPCISVLRSMGFTILRGPSILMMVAGAADNVLGVLLINFILGIMYPIDPNDSIWMRLGSAGAQVLAGACVGILVGKFVVAYINFYIHRLRDYARGAEGKELAVESVKRDTTAFVLITACTMVFGANYYRLPGFGSVAAAASSATIAHTWTEQKQDKRKNDLNAGLAEFWDVAVAPCLFALVGASVNLTSLIDVAFLWKALLCIFGGLLAKWVVVYAMCHGTDFTTGERAFFAIGFSSKATIQAALGGRFAQLAKLHVVAAPEDGTSAEQVQAGANVELVSVLCIILGAIGSGIAMKVAGAKLLVKDCDFVAPHQHQHHQHHQHADPPAAAPPSSSATPADAEHREKQS